MDPTKSRPAGRMPDWARALKHELVAHLLTIEQKVGRLMTAMNDVQAHLDDIAGQIDTATADVTAEIDALKTAHPAVDFTKLETAAASLKNLDVANAPAPAPVPDPTPTPGV